MRTSTVDPTEQGSIPECHTKKEKNVMKINWKGRNRQRQKNTKGMCLGVSKNVSFQIGCKFKLLLSSYSNWKNNSLAIVCNQIGI